MFVREEKKTMILEQSVINVVVKMGVIGQSVFRTSFGDASSSSSDSYGRLTELNLKELYFCFYGQRRKRVSYISLKL